MQTKVELHKQIVQKFLDSKAVDFVAVGKNIAELGPSLSLSDEPEIVFCGTMRTFFHTYVLPNAGSQVENLGALRNTIKEL